MRIVLLGFYLLVSAIVASLAGGFIVALLYSFMLLGPIALLPPGWLLGLLGAVLALKLAVLPAMILGGLLWRYRVRSKWRWAGTGAIAGLGLVALLRFFPGIDSVAGEIAIEREVVLLAPACFLAGAAAALLFRLVMDSLTAFDDAAHLD